MMGAPGLPLSGRVVSTRFGLTVAASGWFGSAHEIRRGEARAGVVPMIIGTIIFVVIAAILCAAALLALLGVGLLALSGPAALERDGLARGQAAPAWSLRDEGVGLEIVILTRGDSGPSRSVLRQLGLGDIPVLSGSPAIYARYNVRVMPFAIFT